MNEQPVPAILLGDVLWQRLDETGLEHCRLQQLPGFLAINGTVLTVHDGSPLRVDYLILCNADWTTHGAHISVVHGSSNQRLELKRAPSGTWQRNGEPVPGLAGIDDVDLAISPASNTLPIRRLALAVGEARDTDAVWVRIPELAIERLSQRYTRTGELRYAYESDRGAFRADIEVDDLGMVVRYGELWERVRP